MSYNTESHQKAGEIAHEQATDTVPADGESIGNVNPNNNNTTNNINILKPNYIVKIDTNSIGEALVSVEASGNQATEVVADAVANYVATQRTLLLKGIVVADPYLLHSEVDTTVRGDPVVKVSGKGPRIVNTYLQYMAKLQKEEATS